MHSPFTHGARTVYSTHYSHRRSAQANTSRIPIPTSHINMRLKRIHIHNCQVQSSLIFASSLPVGPPRVSIARWQPSCTSWAGLGLARMQALLPWTQQCKETHTHTHRHTIHSTGVQSSPRALIHIRACVQARIYTSFYSFLVMFYRGLAIVESNQLLLKRLGLHPVATIASPANLKRMLQGSSTDDCTRLLSAPF